MDFSNDLDDYETNVQNILNDGFKLLIDNVNYSLSQLLEKTIASAENVENGIKREFATLVTNISNMKSLEEMNNAINTTEIEEDLDLASSNDIASDNLYQYQSFSKSVYQETQDDYNEVQFKKEIPFMSPYELEFESKYYKQNNKQKIEEQEFNSKYYKQNNKNLQPTLEAKYYTPKNDDVKSKSDKNSSSANKPEVIKPSENKTSKTVESSVSSNVPEPAKPPSNISTISPEEQAAREKEIMEQRKKEKEAQTMREKEVMEQRKRKMEEMEERKRKFEALDRDPTKKIDQNPFECDQCNYRASRQEFLRRHVTNMARNGLHVKSFDCEYCTAPFEKKKLLEQHLVGKHKIDPSTIRL